MQIDFICVNGSCVKNKTRGNFDESELLIQAYKQIPYHFESEIMQSCIICSINPIIIDLFDILIFNQIFCNADWQ